MKTIYINNNADGTQTVKVAAGLPQPVSFDYDDRLVVSDDVSPLPQTETIEVFIGEEDVNGDGVLVPVFEAQEVLTHLLLNKYSDDEELDAEIKAEGKALSDVLSHYDLLPTTDRVKYFSEYKAMLDALDLNLSEVSAGLIVNASAAFLPQTLKDSYIAASDTAAAISSLGSLETEQDDLDFLPLAGQFLLDPGEYNAYGLLGFTDNTNNQDLANVGEGVGVAVGGIVVPYDCEIVSLFVRYRVSNADSLPWGWRIGTVNTKSTIVNGVYSEQEDLFNQVAAASIPNSGIVLNDPPSTESEILEREVSELSAEPWIVKKNHMIHFGVEAPTALTANRFVQISGGYLLLKRLK